ncbi:hypothetical protein GGH94_005726, partial [Coemansia aciculifera]
NSVDVNGKTCPLLDRAGLTCPVLCVRSFDDCPADIKPASCSDGQQICDDGSCHESCSGIVNPCLCGFAESSVTNVYKACPVYSSTVNIKRYDPSIKQQQLEFTCAQTWGMVASNATVDSGSGIATWTNNATETMLWNVCPTAQEAKLAFKENFCLAFYGIIGVEIVLYLAWHIYKSIRERHAASLRQVCSSLPAKMVASADGQSKEKGIYITSDKRETSAEAFDHVDSFGKGSAVQLPDGMMLLRGFDGDVGGAALYYLALLSTCGWLVVLAIIVADYYGKVKGGVAYGLLANSTTSMYVFVFVWHLGGLWMITMLACKSKLRNYFRIECALPAARVVQVEQRRAEVILMEGEHSRLTALANALRGTLVRRLHLDISAETCSLQKVVVGDSDTRREYIEYRCTRYVLDKSSGRFQSYMFSLGDTHRSLLENGNGLSSSEAQHRGSHIGENFIRVSVSSFPVAVLQEFFSFFYLYQLMAMWVWFYFNYYKMALVQFGVIIISALIKVIIRQRSELKVKSLAEHKSVCRVKRDGQWTELNTADLVPGDVVAVESGMEIMCDGCVLQGEVVVDESSLTGEARPVRKLALKNDDIPYDAVGAGKTYSVFAGTRVLQSQAQKLELDEPETQVLVTRTRTATDKGELIQRILFPTQYSFVFDEQLRVALVILLAYGGFGFGVTIWLMGHDVTSWFYGVFVISQVMSPLLPAALVVGQSVAADRLRRQKIYCVDLPRIMMAGKVQVFCFDKTGTLTKEGLEFLAVQPVVPSQPQPVFGADETDITRLLDVAQLGFASCHAVATVDGQLIGNPVDVEQFRATGWTLQPSDEHVDTLVSPFTANGQRRVAHVLKRFEFVHARQSMSVAVQDAATSDMHVFVKGSFERLRSIAAPGSIPADYDAVAAKWARDGCYVLALAHKNLGQVKDVARMQREHMESGCSLVGLLLFRNKLKDDTAQAIAELRAGNTRTVMITGDSALTAVFIARECGMVSSSARVILGDMEGEDDARRLVWRDTAGDIPVDDIDYSLSQGHVELAVTASAFNHLVTTNAIRKLLFNIRVFARMTPLGKAECVGLHMERAVTGMCGDGGNDCGALRAAHVGLALSESEASIVSPFSSSNRSIHSCVTLLREGRAGLATSFAAYKFLINYATTMSALELTQFYFSVIVPQAVWILIDSFIAVGLCIALTQAQTARTLAPSRPTARLIGSHTLASIWGQTAINYAFLFGLIGLLFNQHWFRCNEFDSRDIDTSLWWILGDNYESELISIVCLFQFVNAAAVYNFGYRYRRSWITNYSLVVLYSGFIAVVSILALANPNRFSCMFRINCGNPDVLVDLGYSRPTWHITPYNSPIGHNVLPHSFRWTLWALCITNAVLCLAYEKLVVLGPVGRYIKHWWIRRTSDRKLKLEL